MRVSRPAAAAALLALGWATCAGAAGADPAAPSPAPPPGPAAAAGPKTTIDHDGVFNVGTDIVPGTYTSAGPVGTGVCYWKRLGSDSKQPIDNAMSKKPQVVRIEPTDKTFKTDGCQAWQKNDAATPDPGQPPEQAALGLGVLNTLMGGGALPTPGGSPSGGAAPAQAPAPAEPTP